MANIKAQASRLFNGIKEAPIAKGVKSTLMVDGLFQNAQQKTLQSINEKALKGIAVKDIPLDEINIGGQTIGGANDAMKEAIEKKMKGIDDLGLDGITDKVTKGYIDTRAQKNPSIAELQKNSILNSAKSNIIGNSKAGASASDLITNSAKSVDGQLSFMTPVNAAMEYYGTPISGAINKVKSADYSGAMKDAGIAGARIGATGLAVGGATMAVKGTANMTRAGISRMRGNTNERE